MPPQPQIEVIDVEEYIRLEARKWGIDEEQFVNTAKCESGLEIDIQSQIIAPDGTQEESWGLWQWNIPSGNKTRDGRVITREMAIDPALSTETAAWYFSRGTAYKKKWTCWRKLYG